MNDASYHIFMQLLTLFPTMINYQQNSKKCKETRTTCKYKTEPTIEPKPTFLIWLHSPIANQIVPTQPTDHKSNHSKVSKNKENASIPILAKVGFVRLKIYIDFLIIFIRHHFTILFIFVRSLGNFDIFLFSLFDFDSIVSLVRLLILVMFMNWYKLL